MILGLTFRKKIRLIHRQIRNINHSLIVDKTVNNNSHCDLCALFRKFCDGDKMQISD